MDSASRTIDEFRVLALYAAADARWMADSLRHLFATLQLGATPAELAADLRVLADGIDAIAGINHDD